jgi:hypothetical protein
MLKKEGGTTMNDRSQHPWARQWKCWIAACVGVGLWWAMVSEGLAAEPVKGWAGQLDASWHWQLPDTPNGLKPTQSWHAIGSSPDGNIYIGGMDHVTNSALYRLDPLKGTIRYVGDARTASEAANNWAPGETAQKFHTRPLWYRGKVYVATMDRSELNDEYLSRRGFHWYAYDPVQDTFIDLSAAEPGGTATEHGSLVTITVDPKLNVLYGASVPTADIFRYDIAEGRTKNLGRPTAYDKKYLYSGRVMWVDSRSRLYFAAGRGGSHNPSIYSHIYYYDPLTGFGERQDWALQEPRAIELGQCRPNGKQCFFSDDHGHIYRFDDQGPSWSYLGQAQTDPDLIWLFHVSADGRKAYLVTSRGKNSPPQHFVYEFDLNTGTTRRLCSLADLDPKLATFTDHTGYNAWDTEGRFYFASFTPWSTENVMVTRLDPVRLKATLGLLPSLTEVTVDRAPEADIPHVVITRTGSTVTSQEVLYRLVVTEANGSQHEQYGTIVIPENAASIIVPLHKIWTNNSTAVERTVLSLIPNGNDYTVGSKRHIAF